MLIKFSIIEISTSLIEKKIIVNFNKDIDAITVNKNTLELINRNLRQIVEIEYEIIDKQIIITLIDEPIVNEEYMLNIKANLSSISGDLLGAAMSQRIMFESVIQNTVKIISPIDHELLSNVVVSWKEIQENNSLPSVQQYMVEIADDNTFFNVRIRSTVKDRNEIKFAGNLSDGQYYVRVRVQTDTDYGRWSDPVTFVLERKNADDEIVFEEELEILNQSENGVEMEYFLFEFDADLDVELFDKDDIVIVRRDI